ncbi:MAG: TspO/MBR family protein [Pseudomonadota bacterium]
MLTFVAFGALSFVTALSGTVFRPGLWYESLDKPQWQPPNWLFGPVWAILYVMIAIAGTMIWNAQPANLVLIMSVFGLQLALNAGWSAVFFGLKRMDLAFVEVLLLWSSIIATMIVFAPVDTRAAWLLVPYLAWVTFAAFLNFVMLRMNPQYASAT